MQKLDSDPTAKMTGSTASPRGLLTLSSKGDAQTSTQSFNASMSRHDWNSSSNNSQEVRAKKDDDSACPNDHVQGLRNSATPDALYSKLPVLGATKVVSETKHTENSGLAHKAGGSKFGSRGVSTVKDKAGFDRSHQAPIQLPFTSAAPSVPLSTHVAFASSAKSPPPTVLKKAHRVDVQNNLPDGRSMSSASVIPGQNTRGFLSKHSAGTAGASVSRGWVAPGKGVSENMSIALAERQSRPAGTVSAVFDSVSLKNPTIVEEGDFRDDLDQEDWLKDGVDRPDSSNFSGMQVGVDLTAGEVSIGKLELDRHADPPSITRGSSDVTLPRTGTAKQKLGPDLMMNALIQKSGQGVTDLLISPSMTGSTGVLISSAHGDEAPSIAVFKPSTQVVTPLGAGPVLRSVNKHVASSGSGSVATTQVVPETIGSDLVGAVHRTTGNSSNPLGAVAVVVSSSSVKQGSHDLKYSPLLAGTLTQHVRAHTTGQPAEDGLPLSDLDNAIAIQKTEKLPVDSARTLSSDGTLKHNQADDPNSTIDNPFQRMDTFTGPHHLRFTPSIRNLEAGVPETGQGVSTVSARLVDGKINASMSTITVDSASSISTQLPSLHAFMAEGGVPLKQVTINMEAGQRGHSPQDSKEPEQPQVGPDLTTQQLPFAHALESRDLQIGRINLRA